MEDRGGASFEGGAKSSSPDAPQADGGDPDSPDSPDRESGTSGPDTPRGVSNPPAVPASSKDPPGAAEISAKVAAAWEDAERRAEEERCAPDPPSLPSRLGVTHPRPPLSLPPPDLFVHVRRTPSPTPFLLVFLPSY